MLAIVHRMASFVCVEDEVTTMITDEFRDETSCPCSAQDIAMLEAKEFDQTDSKEECKTEEMLNNLDFVDSLKSDSSDNNLLTKKICEHFNEKNIPVIESIVFLIGKENSILLVQDTLNIEERGGMLTEVGLRRSAGGVFLKLVESRQYLTDTQKKESKEEIRRVNKIGKASKKNKKQRLKLKALKEKLKSKYLPEEMYLH